MEYVEAALKTSIRKEMAVKANGPQALVFDDLLWGGAVVNGQNACDDFSVDDLLDFSNKDRFFETEGEEEDKKEKIKAFVSVSPQKQNQETEKSNLSKKFEPATELSVPADDLANLEWLSHFVEDSFSEFATALPAGFVPENPKSEKRPDRETPFPEKCCFNTPVPAKARSKRTRTGGRGRSWSLGSPSLTGIIPTQYALKVAVPGSGVSKLGRLLLGGNYLSGPIPRPLLGLKPGSANVVLGNK